MKGKLIQKTMLQSDWILVLLFATLITCVLIKFGSNGVRGTDQYWYLGDVETVAKDAPPFTNIVYPGKLLRESNGPPSPNYFMHNGPFISVVALISNYFTPYASWILLNFISHITIAISVFFICRAYADKAIAGWITSLYLVSPIAIWQTLNMLQEQLYAGCLALILAGFIFRRRWQMHAIFITALAIGILSHPIFFVLANALLLYLLLFHVIERDPVGILRVGLLAVSFYLLQHYKSHLFPSSFQPDLSSIIAGAIPGVSNMVWHYSDVLDPIDIFLFLEKFKYAFSEHFLVIRNLPLYLYTNIAMVCGIFLFFFRLKQYREVVLAACASLAAYGGILVLMQTQARYQQIVAPAAFVLIAIVVHELRNVIKPKFAKAFGLLLLILSISLGFVMAKKTRSESQLESMDLATVAEHFDGYPETTKFLLLDLRHELKLSYALRPRQVLAIKSKFISSSSFTRAVDLFSADYLISQTSNVIPPLKIIKVDEIRTKALGIFYLYQLDRDRG